MMKEHKDLNIGAANYDGEIEVACMCGELLLSERDERTNVNMTELIALWQAHIAEVKRSCP